MEVFLCNPREATWGVSATQAEEVSSGPGLPLWVGAAGASRAEGNLTPSSKGLLQAGGVGLQAAFGAVGWESCQRGGKQGAWACWGSMLPQTFRREIGGENGGASSVEGDSYFSRCHQTVRASCLENRKSNFAG